MDLGGLIQDRRLREWIYDVRTMDLCMHQISRF